MGSVSFIDEKSKGRRYCPRCKAIYLGALARCPNDGAELAAFDQDPVVGLQLGNYVLEEYLGEGATGRVYRARHARLSRKKYAVKVLLGDLAMDANMRTRFAREADAASRLDHRNLVGVHDFGQSDDGLFYIVMEFVPGETLARRIYRLGWLGEEETVHLTRLICHGLAHAHSKGLIHRDFKPENVVVLEQDGMLMPRILDFGLAIVEDPEESNPRLTEAGSVVGTPAYAAPEQIGRGKIDSRTDLFALGVTMFEMLSGKLPFDGDIMEILVSTAKKEPPSIRERSGLEVNPALEALVQGLMAKRKKDRPGSAKKVIATLDQVAHALGYQVPKSGTFGAVPTEFSGMNGTHSELETGETMMPGDQSRPRFVDDEDESEDGGAGLPEMIEAPRIRRPRRSVVVLAVALLLVSSIAGALIMRSMTRDSETDSQAAALEPSSSERSDDEAKLEAEAPTPDEPGKESEKPAPLPDSEPESVDPSPKKEERLPDSRSSNNEAERSRKKTTRRSTESERPASKTEPPKPKTKTEPPKPKTKTEPPKPKTETEPPKPKTEVAKPVEPREPTLPALDARVSVAKISSQGSLPKAGLKRAIKGVPSSRYRSCYRHAAKASGRDQAMNVKVSFKVGSSRRARDIRVTGARLPGLAGCIKKTASEIRTRRAPDIGTQKARFVIRFKPLPMK